MQLQWENKGNVFLNVGDYKGFTVKRDKQQIADR